MGERWTKSDSVNGKKWGNKDGEEFYHFYIQTYIARNVTNRFEILSSNLLIVIESQYFDISCMFSPKPLSVRCVDVSYALLSQLLSTYHYFFTSKLFYVFFYVLSFPATMASWIAPLKFNLLLFLIFYVFSKSFFLLSESLWEFSFTTLLLYV